MGRSSSGNSTRKIVVLYMGELIQKPDYSAVRVSITKEMRLRSVRMKKVSNAMIGVVSFLVVYGYLTASPLLFLLSLVPIECGLICDAMSQISNRVADDIDAIDNVSNE